MLCLTGLVKLCSFGEQTKQQKNKGPHDKASNHQAH